MASLPLLRLSLLPSPKPHSPYPISAIRIPHSLISTAKITRPKLTPSRAPTSMSYNPTPASDRLISTASYFLPFFNGIQYGRFLFSKYPSLALFFQPILPVMSLYRSIPYASFVAFFALYLGVVRNPSFSRYIRFNAMQAVVLDVLLAIPLLLQRIFSPERGLGFRFVVMGYDALFVFIVACFLYSVGFCILGKTPYLPFVASAADRQL
ncbi:protein TIC 20-II, chloroplastic [Magnolia sinica]|uniref:protein TIC 20-II, chloroplastic n=1 Tax=Magnolia sinica TaxID=86752 RepID=UPI002658A049|nr:protein TIC 20-II, chloroplastic [Magnolia sinica]